MILYLQLPPKRTVFVQNGGFFPITTQNFLLFLCGKANGPYIGVGGDMGGKNQNPRAALYLVVFALVLNLWGWNEFSIIS